MSEFWGGRGSGGKLSTDLICHLVGVRCPENSLIQELSGSSHPLMGEKRQKSHIGPKSFNQSLPDKLKLLFPKRYDRDSLKNRAQHGLRS